MKTIRFATGKLAVACVLVGSTVASAHTYRGTANNDVIYFGYCNSCNGGNPGVLVCSKQTDGSMDETTFGLHTGTLSIEGRGGHDYIRAIHSDTIRPCVFGDYASLPFARIEIHGGVGNDGIVGTQFDDILFGEQGNDYLRGYAGVDELYGGSGQDYLQGDQGDDELYGEGDNDTLEGGTGDDMIDGGNGMDTFRCRSDRRRTRFDPAAAFSDCSDTRGHPNVEKDAISEPYAGWAPITHFRDGLIYEQGTTSNPARLLVDRAGGASILMVSGGDIPLAGDFDEDGRADDLAMFRAATGEWFYDFDHNGSTDATGRRWGRRGDRPVVGDFDGDGKLDDLAIFRPSNRMWYFDYDHDGRTNITRGPWGNAGDVPIAGDFDSDGLSDDLGVFRPQARRWYYDYDHDGTTNDDARNFGLPGDIPVAGDFDGDGFYDDTAVYRPSTGVWYFDHDHNATRDVMGPSWGKTTDIPLAGDFDNDRRRDDLALFSSDSTRWVFDLDHDGDTDTRAGSFAWGFAGEPLAVTHKQYGDTCGPSSFNMVLEYLGIADRGRRLFYSRNLNDALTPVHMSGWGAGTAADVGYYGSMEHLMYLGYWRKHDLSSYGGTGGFIDASGNLDTSEGAAGSGFEINYNIGALIWNPATSTLSANGVQRWIHNGGAVGWENLRDRSRGLPWAASQFSRHNDVMNVGAGVGRHGDFASFNHVKAVIRAFTDHNIPLTVAIENGGHFNTVVGYWERGSEFFVYLADPLDGWGRPYYLKPMRWRRLPLSETILRDGRWGGMFSAVVLFGHGRWCGSGGWANELDRQYRSNLLCGHVD